MNWTPREIAAWLFVHCNFRYKDGRFYRDDALDCFVILFEGRHPEWGDVLAELEGMFGVEYARLGYQAHSGVEELMDA